MELLRAEIENFRSIEDLKIPLEAGCHILLGINESGKSNILRALHLLDPSVQVTASDLRIERQNEEPLSEGLVRFVFRLDDAELEAVHSAILPKFLGRSADAALVLKAGQPLTLREFIWDRREGTYRIDLPSGDRSAKYWTVPKTYTVAPGWKRLKGSDERQILTKGDAQVTAPANSILHSEFFKALDATFLEPVLIEHLASMVGSELIKVVNKNLPTCIYWKFSDKYLLPSSINVESFAANPSSCLPLMSMFELAGFAQDQIGPVITTALQQAPHRYLHLLEKVASAATRHLHEIWPEHSSAKIFVRPHGTELVPVIQDSDVPLDMANRSDGFKRFVSFLLLISAKVKTNQIRDTLILVDEPEIALHPSGCRSLMKELIRIGGSNTVVYSTHSIFMVDRDHVDRHVVVERKNEVTTTWQASKSRIQDEEVLYSAIGYSIFETLKPHNVIFEGWKDKQLFRVLQDAIPKERKDLRQRLSVVGLTFAEGVKDVRHVGKFLELANRNCLVISDADGPGEQWQKEHQKSGSWGTWLTLKDIFKPQQIVTAEDLLTPECVARRAVQFRKRYPTLPEFQTEWLTEKEPTERVILKWLATAATEQLTVKMLQEEFKDLLFEKLKRDDLRAEAEKLLEVVAAHFSKEAVDAHDSTGRP